MSPTRPERSARLALVSAVVFLLAGFVAGPATAWTPAPLGVPAVTTGQRADTGFPVPASLFEQAVSLSAGRALALSGEPLVLSNSPEFPDQPGILLQVNDVGAGRFRLLYSHADLLYDLTDPRVDDPATIGLAVVNHTGRAVSLFWTRRATVRTTDAAGALLGPVDRAPSRPGGSGADYGGREGSTLVAKWFQSGDGRQEHRLADLAPGGVYLYHKDVGPGSWAMGLFDFVLRDQKTGRLVDGAGVGVEVLITRYGTDFASFYRLANRLNLVLPADDAKTASPTPFHQRGLFPGADREITVRYDPAPGKRPMAVQLAQRFDAQNRNPVANVFQPDMFVNDVSVDGHDDHPPVRAQDSGNYGVEYVLRLHVSGPAAIAVQPALRRAGGPLPVDMYDQYLVFDLDGDVRTVSFQDPRWADYYRSPGSLAPPGWGRVVYLLRPAGHTYILRTTLPPNGYGPFTIMILPAPGSGVPVYPAV